MGDRNSKFSHRTANSHRRFNTINNLEVDGELTSNPSSITACISLFYKQLYSKNEGQRLVKWNFLGFAERMQLGWTDPLKNMRFIVLSKIEMVTNLQGQMVSRWLSFSLVGIF